jgi:hypothetical protein
VLLLYNFNCPKQNTENTNKKSIHYFILPTSNLLHSSIFYIIDWHWVNFSTKIVSSKQCIIIIRFYIGSVSTLQSRLVVVRWGGDTLYKLFSNLIFTLCGTWVFSNTPPHALAHHYWAWCVDINGRRTD